MSEDIRRDLQHPLYEWTQVITHDELHMLVEEMYVTYHATPWIKWRDKLKLAGAFSTLRILLIWLHSGKPQAVPFIQNRDGGTNGEEN